MVTGNGNFHYKFDDFRGFAGFHQFQRHQFEIGALLMKYILFILGRGWISRIPPSLTVPMVGNKEKPKLGEAKFCLHNMPFILGRGRISGFPFIAMVPMARSTENPRFFKDGYWKKIFSPDFRRFEGLRQFQCLQRKIGVWFSIMKFCL